MAEIKILENISLPYSASMYDSKDARLLNQVSSLKGREYNPNTDTIVAEIFDIQGVKITEISNYQNYKQTLLSTLNDDGGFTEIQVNPAEDLKSLGFSEGTFRVKYSVLRPLINDPYSDFYVNQISSTRTEIVVRKINANTTKLIDQVNALKTRLTSANDIKDFLVKTENGLYVIATNIAVNNANDGLFQVKLYAPLPTNAVVKSYITLFEELSAAFTYQVSLTKTITPSPPKILPVGPIFSVTSNNNSQSTQNNSYQNLTSLINATSLHEINNLISKNNIKLNIDYRIGSYHDFYKFINFSSPSKRIEVFRKKVNDLQSLTESKVSSSLANLSTSSLDTQFNTIINNLDHWEQYLYFESGSSAWPKSNSTRPYALYATGSSQAIQWYSGIKQAGDEFNLENNNYLWYTIPEFIRNNPDNANLNTFTDMIGHHYDNIWIIIKNLTEIHNTKHDNKLSNEIMYEILKSYGYNIRNSSSNEGLDSYLRKTDTQKAQSDYINEIYQRLHHNLPILAKTRGTYEGLRLLLLVFGLPDTIIEAQESGEIFKDEKNMYTYKSSTYNYSTNMTGSSYYQLDWNTFNDNIKTTEFRFKLDKEIPNNTTHSLFKLYDDIYRVDLLDLQIYQNSASSSYNDMKFILRGDNGLVSGSISMLPVNYYTGSWWSVMMQISSSANTDTYKLFVKNEIGGKLAYSGSASYVINNSASASYRTNYYTDYATAKFGQYISGSISDIRFWNYAKKESDFNYFVLNPRSIQETVYGPTASLFARFPLGTDLKISTGSFSDNFYGSVNNINGVVKYIKYYNSSDAQIHPTLSGSRETFYYSTPYVGIGTPTSNKIYVNYNSVPSPFVLTRVNKLTKSLTTSSSSSVSTLNVGTSIVDSINKKIASTYGSFDVGNYIGDPNPTGSNYNGLDVLRVEYFSNYNK
jgi:hypothetical protein